MWNLVATASPSAAAAAATRRRCTRTATAHVLQDRVRVMECLLIV